MITRRGFLSGIAAALVAPLPERRRVYSFASVTIWKPPTIDLSKLHCGYEKMVESGLITRKSTLVYPTSSLLVRHDDGREYTVPLKFGFRFGE